jgi:XTP/dITP diphosphohydrolase
MTTLVLATTSAGKLRELRAELADTGFDPILTLKELPSVSLFPEDGRTFEENAIGKALYYSRATPHLTVADDSGLEVQYLEGGPGVYSARFGGEHVSYDEKNRMILHLLEGVQDKARTARFRCVLAVAQRESVLAVFHGTVEGWIAHVAAGSGGFGYDPIFYVPSLGKTLAQVPLETKNTLSHRGKAARKLRSYLLENRDRLAAAPEPSP